MQMTNAQQQQQCAKDYKSADQAKLLNLSNALHAEIGQLRSRNKELEQYMLIPKRTLGTQTKLQQSIPVQDKNATQQGKLAPPPTLPPAKTLKQKVRNWNDRSEDPKRKSNV